MLGFLHLLIVTQVSRRFAVSAAASQNRFSEN
jgi:hypothetical protein